METREQRGIIIAALCRLTRKDARRWIVPSQTAADKRYVVDPQDGTCTCPDHQETGFKCKHQYAVEFTVQWELFDDGTVTETRSVTFTEKKSYSQDWRAYTRAQMVEKYRVRELLADLCRDLPAPERRGRGRPAHPLKDRIFSSCFRVYCGMSSRRWACDMKDAHEAGFLGKPIHPSKVCAFLCESDLTPILSELVARSALPLAAIESKFAVDSSGFSVCKFVRWHDEKYGKERSGKEWVKAHICTGVTTNVVTAVAIHERHAADCPILPELVDKTAERFRIREVSADKAYMSVANVDAICEHGGTPFIAPKTNTTGKAGGPGGMFEKMIHFYRFNSADYMSHYHQRSNVESTFSAVKRLFGDFVRSTNPTAMVNEVLCKFICYNLTCVVHSQCELGIEANFWADAKREEEPEPAILKFCRR